MVSGAGEKFVNSAILKTIDELTPSLTALFSRIGSDSFDGEGTTRDAFGARETAAAETLAAFAHGKGLDAAFDGVGNLHVSAAGELDHKPEIMLASHVDSVPCGGNYDGLAGVIGGIAALLALRGTGNGTRGLRVVGFRGEESPWFGTAYLGAKLLLGDLTPADLKTLRRFDTGRTLADHIAALGIALPAGQPKPAIPLDKLRAYLELHIEQGPLLEELGSPFGVATAMRGNIRFPFAKCLGEYAHSSAIPRPLRRDAVMATAKLLAAADERWRTLYEAGHQDLVFSCGIFHTDAAENAMTKIPGEVTFSLNMGGTDDVVMEDLCQTIFKRADELAHEHRVTFDFGKRVGTPALALDPSVIAAVESAAKEIGTEAVRMPTVGHDAAMFARRKIPSSVLLIRNSHGSHNPAEHMEMADFITGVKVLATTASRMTQNA
jgi:N-carbamoyl-L-amino-acid hydrolase